MSRFNVVYLFILKKKRSNSYDNNVCILMICDRSIFYSKRKYYIFILIKYLVIIVLNL